MKGSVPRLRATANAALLIGLLGGIASAQTTQTQTTQTTISMNFTGAVMGVFGNRDQNVQGTGTVAPFGNATLNATISAFTFTFSSGDTITGQVQASESGTTANAALSVISGTGMFAGAGGSAQLTLVCQSDCEGTAGVAYTAPFIGSGSGTIILPAKQPPLLSVAPGLLNFAGQAGSSGPQQQSIVVQDAGGGSVAFAATVVSGSPWLSITPSSGAATSATPAPVTVTVNTQALPAGSYRDAIHFSSPNGSADVPVSLFATNAGAILGAGPSGVVFNVLQGAGGSASQTIGISNDGSPGSTVNWTASVAADPGVPNGGFLSFGNPSGLVQPGTLGSLTLSLNSNAASLTAGVYYELAQISSPGAQNSPQYVTAVLNVAPPSASVPPTLNPAGLLFIGAVGQTISPQHFTVNWSSLTFQPIQAVARMPPGQSWLEAATPSASASSNSPALMTAAVTTLGLSAGVYPGTIDLTTAGGGSIGSVNVTLIVTGGAGASAAVHPQVAAGCTPTALALTETGIPNNFSVPAGWPANLVATMTDNCGNPVEGGAVTASFSNGDAPLSLDDQGSGGLYVATWQPSNLSGSGMTVLLTGTAGTLTPASSRLSGLVNHNQAPFLNANGIVNGFTFLAGGALAPGTVADAFGSSLTTSQNPVSPNTSPLPTAFANTQLVVGGYLAPLYYLSPTQLNVQIPAEIAALQQVPAVAVVNGALTLPVQIALVPVAPAAAAYSDGSAIAQHSDFTLVNSGNPAHPGESLMIYLVGMGATTPAVASGAAAPGLNLGDTLAAAVVQPLVNVANQPAHVQFAGLTPGAIGLYQINFVVPTTLAAPGNLSLTVSQGGVNANLVTLPVSFP